MTGLRFFLQRYICEILWPLRLAGDSLRHPRFYGRKKDVHMQSSPMHAARERAVRRQKLLRSMLQTFPYWALGHVRLGLAELELGSYSDEPLSARSRAAIRLSAQAAEKLVVEFHEPANCRAALEAAFLSASLDFSERKFAEAAEKYSRLLEPQNVVQLHQDVQRRAAENHAVCASVLSSA